MSRSGWDLLENATAITDAAPMSETEMEALGAALIRGARAIRENRALRQEIRWMKEERDRDAREALERSQELVGLMLEATLTGVIVAPTADDEKGGAS